MAEEQTGQHTNDVSKNQIVPNGKFGTFLGTATAFVGLIAAMVGIYINLQSMERKAALDEKTADFNYKTEVAKIAFAEKQMNYQGTQHLEDTRLAAKQHEQDLHRQEKADEAKALTEQTERVSKLITDLFLSDRGSEGSLAVLSSYASESAQQSSAIANALLAKLGTTTSMGDVEISFRLVDRLGYQMIPVLTEVNRMARRRYDDAIRNQYLLWMSQYIEQNLPAAKSGGQLAFDFVSEASNIAATKFGHDGYVIGTLNQPDFPGPRHFTVDPQVSVGYSWPEVEREFVIPTPTTDPSAERRISKEILERSLRALKWNLEKSSSRNLSSLDLHDCYLDGLPWPTAIRKNVIFTGAWLGLNTEPYMKVQFDPESRRTLLNAQTFHMIALQGPEAGWNSQNLSSTFDSPR